MPRAGSSFVLRAIFALIGLLSARPLAACGLTPPIGATGLPATCRGDAGGVKGRVGVAVGGTSTRIDFGNQSSPLLQGALSATLDLLPSERLSLSGSLGSALPGRIDYGGERFQLSAGPLVGVGAGYRLFGGRAPFLHASVSLSWARSRAVSPAGERSTFSSSDYRLGIALGKTLAGWAAPFVVFRYFGAGTNWSLAGHGGDHYRYQVGAGAAFALSRQFDALVELAFLGERRATLGVGYNF